MKKDCLYENAREGMNEVDVKYYKGLKGQRVYLTVEFEEVTVNEDGSITLELVPCLENVKKLTTFDPPSSKEHILSVLDGSKIRINAAYKSGGSHG